MTNQEWSAEKQYYSHMASGITGKQVIVLDAAGDELGYTSKGNKIHIAKEHLLYTQMPQNEATAVRFGVAVHESLHQVFTNFDYISKIEKDLIRKKIIETQLDMEAYHTIVNLIEDPAIENMAANLIGGPALRALDFTIRKLYELSGDFDKGCKYPFDEVVNALIQFGDLGIIKGTFRYKTAEIVFRRITPMFYQAINEPNCKKRVDMALPIFTECARLWAGRTSSEQKAMLNEHRKNTSARGKNYQSHDANGSGSTGTMHEDTEKNRRRQEEMQKSKKKEQSSEKSVQNSEEIKDRQKEANSDQTSINTHGPTNLQQQEKQEERDSGQTNRQEQKQEMLKNNEEKSDAFHQLPRPTLSEKDMESILDHILEYLYDEESKNQDNQEYYRPFEEFKELDNSKTFQKVKVQNQYVDHVSVELSRQYDRIVELMHPGISAVVQQLREIFIADRVCKVYSESGRASMKRFASGKVTTRLFERRRKPGHREDMCVAIIGDCSGSMEYNGKMLQEQLTIIALAEIFSEFDIPFYFMGFHVPNVPVQNHYIRWDNTREERERLMRFTCCGTNFDSYSIRYATNLLRERPERHKLLIVLSDGLPSYYFSGSEGIKQNTMAIQDARMEGIDVFGIGIGTVDAKAFCKMYQKEYFLNVMQPNDLFEKLAEQITTVVNGWE